jgi:hypothetical protein
VLRFADEEAAGRGHTFIGTEHLWLGLLREPKGVAMQGRTTRNRGQGGRGLRQRM